MIYVLSAFAVIRVVIGLAPIVAAGPLVRVLGFPAAEDTASARAFARLFGVRDIGLGVVIAYALGRPDLWMAVVVLNGATDLGDLLTFLVALRGRPDLRRSLGVCAAVAGAAVVAWTAVGLALP